MGVNLRANFPAKISALFQNRDSSLEEGHWKARISESVILEAHWRGRIYPSFQAFWTIVFILYSHRKRCFDMFQDEILTSRPKNKEILLARCKPWLASEYKKKCLNAYNEYIYSYIYICMCIYTYIHKLSLYMYECMYIYVSDIHTSRYMYIWQIEVRIVVTVLLLMAAAKSP